MVDRVEALFGLVTGGESGVAAWNEYYANEATDGADLRGANLRAADLRGADLRAADLRGADLRGVNLRSANLSGANLSDADLSHAYLADAVLSSARLHRTNLHGAELVRANLVSAELVRANLRDTMLIRANLGGSFLRGADLRGADLAGAHLAGANLRGADLRDASLGGAVLGDAILRAADLRGADLGGADLVRADLGGADLRDTFLLGAKLHRANLHGADLMRANLRDANLDRADLRGAYLRGANLCDAHLNGARLDDANLIESTLVRTGVDSARLAGCRVYGASVWDLQGQPADQSSLVITPDGENAVTVDNIKVAQFIYLLLENEEIRDVLNTVGEKAVLILGRFTDRMHILDRIRQALREMGFLPIVFDFERPTTKDFTETVKTLAGLSAFIIADITAPRSVPKELQATVPDYMVPLKPIIQNGEEPFSMFADLKNQYDWVLKPLSYESAEQLLEVLEPLVVRPALEMRNKLIARRAQVVEIEDAGDYLTRLREGTGK